MTGGMATKTAVMGAVGLYILFINIFQILLMLMGNRD
jgi:FtsH-binding integral membrane protein